MQRVIDKGMTYVLFLNEDDFPYGGTLSRIIHIVLNIGEVQKYKSHSEGYIDDLAADIRQHAERYKLRSIDFPR